MTPSYIPASHKGSAAKGITDERKQGTVADAGQAVQQKINQAADAQDQIAGFIRDNPISAALIAVGIGYILGKIT